MSEVVRQLVPKERCCKAETSPTELILNLRRRKLLDSKLKVDSLYFYIVQTWKCNHPAYKLCAGVKSVDSGMGLTLFVLSRLQSYARTLQTQYSLVFLGIYEELVPRLARDGFSFY